MYSAGRARHRITFQVHSQARNELGELTHSWSDFVTVNAVITQQKAAESWAPGGKQFVNEYPTQFEIRYREDLSNRYRDDGSAMRIVWRSRVFRVDSMRDPAEGRFQLTVNGIETKEAVA